MNSTGQAGQAGLHGLDATHKTEGVKNWLIVDEFVKSQNQLNSCFGAYAPKRVSD